MVQLRSLKGGSEVGALQPLYIHTGLAPILLMADARCGQRELWFLRGPLKLSLGFVGLLLKRSRLSK